MSNLMNDDNIFIRNLVQNITKTEYIKAALYSGCLYIVTLNGILYYVNITNKISCNLSCGFSTDTLKSNPDYIFDNENISMDVVNKFKECGCIHIPGYPMYDIPDIRSDPNFESMIDAKSADGAFRYFLPNGSFMILYRGMFNLNKPDKVSLQVYNTPHPNVLLAYFIIHKKKINMDYKMYFLFMDLRQR